MGKRVLDYQRIFAEAIDPSRILSGCASDRWMVPEGKMSVIKLNSCLD